MIKNYKKYSEKITHAFTLVETMVAITVLSMAMLAPFYAAQQSLTASETARNRLTAAMLAEESIEYVREIRDDNFLAGYGTGSPIPWLTGLTNCVSHQCTVDATLPAPTGITWCNGTECGSRFPLYINDASGEYTQDANSNTQTIFNRNIQLTQISTNEEEVVSTVTWTDHAAFSKPSTFTITEYLTNWQ